MYAVLTQRDYNIEDAHLAVNKFEVAKIAHRSFDILVDAIGSEEDYIWYVAGTTQVQNAITEQLLQTLCGSEFSITDTDGFGVIVKRLHSV